MHLGKQLGVREEWHEYLGSYTHVGDSWLQSGPGLVVTAIWGVNLQLEFFFSLLCNSDFPIEKVS